LVDGLWLVRQGTIEGPTLHPGEGLNVDE
jgi:hypothetical protein